jgi:MFS family permease
MADVTEKHLDNVHEHERTSINKHEVVNTKLVQGDDNYAQALIKEPPKPWAGVSITLYIISIVGFFCSTTNGFDSSLFGALLNNKRFLAFFNVGNVGIGAGIVSSMSQIGSVVSVPFVGPAIDTWGRRVGMLIGGIIICIGVIIQGTVINTNNSGQFMAGRFFMGFGVNVISAAGPCYIVEICHPAYRGIVVGLYNVFW